MVSFEAETSQKIPDQQLETSCSSAAQSFQHREVSCSSGQPQTLQISLADRQVDEVINEATSYMVRSYVFCIPVWCVDILFFLLS